MSSASRSVLSRLFHSASGATQSSLPRATRPWTEHGREDAVKSWMLQSSQRLTELQKQYWKEEETYREVHGHIYHDDFVFQGSSVFTYAFSYMLRREGRAADEVMEARRTEVSSRETEVSSREVDVSREVEAIRLKTKRDVAVMSHLSAMFPTSRTFGTLGELLIEVDRICQNGYFPDLVQKFRGQKGFYPDFLHTKQIHETIKTIVHIADAEWRKYTLDDVLTEADLYYTGCVPFLEHSLDDLTTLLQYRTASQITFKDIFDHPDFAIDPAATDPRVIATHFFKWMEVVRNWRRNNSQVLASTAIATATEALATAIATMTATETEKETATGTGTGTEISTAATDILTTRSLMSVPATETAIVTEGPTRRSLMSRLSPFKSRSH